MKRFLLIGLYLLLFCGPARSQQLVEANLGLGLYEGMSLKAKFGHDFQIAIAQGFAQGSFWMTGIEGYYHFAGNSELTLQRTFYFMTGVSSTLITPGYGLYEKIIIYPRIGRTFNLSSRTGVNLDVGMALLMADDIDGYHSFPSASGSFHVFMRF